MSTGVWIITVSCVVSVCIGVPGNFLIVLVNAMRRVKRRKLTAYAYLATHLAVADFLFSVTLIFEICVLFNRSQWQFGKTMCKTVKSVQFASLSSTTVFLTFMAYKKYLGVTHPMKQRWSIRKTSFIVLGIWALIALTMLPYVLALDVAYGECYDAHYTSATFTKAYTTYLFITTYVVPLACITYLHVKIVTSIRNQQRIMKSHSHRGGATPEVKKKINKNKSSSYHFSSVCSNTSNHSVSTTCEQSPTADSIKIPSQMPTDYTDTKSPSPKCLSVYYDSSRQSRSDSVFTSETDFPKTKAARLFSRMSIISRRKRSLSKARNNRKVQRMLFTITLCFSVMTLPTQSWYLLHTFSYSSTIVGQHVMEVLSSLLYLQGCVNFLIYGLMDRKFRLDLKQLFAPAKASLKIARHVTSSRQYSCSTPRQTQTLFVKVQRIETVLT